MYEFIHVLLLVFEYFLEVFLTNLYQVYTYCRMRCGMCLLVESPR